jgi:hypothetical protein
MIQSKHDFKKKKNTSSAELHSTRASERRIDVIKKKLSQLNNHTSPKINAKHKRKMFSQRDIRTITQSYLNMSPIDKQLT